MLKATQYLSARAGMFRAPMSVREALGLPASHRAVLARWGGLVTNDGLARLRGSERVHGMDSIEEWNLEPTWKFAWPRERCLAEYLCFGETAFGDQYAYRVDEMTREHAPVYMLGAETMESRQIADDFDDFVEGYLLIDHEDPGEWVTAAMNKFGTVDPSMQVALIPPPIVQDTENPEYVLMPARTHLIALGDLYTQIVFRNKANRSVSGLEQYTDAAGRPRIRVRF